MFGATSLVAERRSHGWIPGRGTFPPHQTVAEMHPSPPLNVAEWARGATGEGPAVSPQNFGAITAAANKEGGGEVEWKGCEEGLGKAGVWR